MSASYPTQLDDNLSHELIRLLVKNIMLPAFFQVFCVFFFFFNSGKSNSFLCLEMIH